MPPKTSAGRQEGAKFWLARDPEKGAAKDETSPASSFCWCWPYRKQGHQHPPLSHQAHPCLQPHMPRPSHRMALCMGAATLLFAAKCIGAPGYQLKQPGVLTERQVRGRLGIGLKALQLWVSMVTQAPPSFILLSPPPVVSLLPLLFP